MDRRGRVGQPNYILIADFHDFRLGNLNSTVATKLTVERQSLSSQFAPHARQMPVKLMITKEAAEMQPDAIEATQLDRYSGVV